MAGWNSHNNQRGQIIRFYVAFTCLEKTVKSLYLVDTKFGELTTMDMLVDTWIHGFQIIFNITKVK